jgi:hypothetical protein
VEEFSGSQNGARLTDTAFAIDEVFPCPTRENSRILPNVLSRSFPLSLFSLSFFLHHNNTLQSSMLSTTLQLSRSRLPTSLFSQQFLGRQLPSTVLLLRRQASTAPPEHSYQPHPNGKLFLVALDENRADPFTPLRQMRSSRLPLPPPKLPQSGNHHVRMRIGSFPIQSTIKRTSMLWKCFTFPRKPLETRSPGSWSTSVGKDSISSRGTR